MIFAISGTIVVNSAFSQNVTICQGYQATILGTNGDDIIVGTDGDDVIVGRGGNDTITGRHGNDIICGNDGDDDLNGNEDNDILVGGDGDDILFGGKQDDVLIGGPGSDTFDGYKGVDECDFVKNVDVSMINCEKILGAGSSQYGQVTVIPEDNIQVEGFVGTFIFDQDYFTLHLDRQFELDLGEDILTIFNDEDTEFLGFDDFTKELVGLPVKVNAKFIDGRLFATSVFLKAVEEKIDEGSEEKQDEVGLKGSLIEVREGYFKLQVDEDILEILTDEDTEFQGFENLIDPLGRIVEVKAVSIDGGLLAKEIELGEGEVSTQILEKSIVKLLMLITNLLKFTSIVH